MINAQVEFDAENSPYDTYYCQGSIILKFLLISGERQTCMLGYMSLQKVFKLLLRTFSAKHSGTSLIDFLQIKI